MKASDHFEALYGNMNLTENDAARHVFMSGWHAAMSEVFGLIQAYGLDRATSPHFKKALEDLIGDADED